MYRIMAVQKLDATLVQKWELDTPLVERRELVACETERMAFEVLRDVRDDPSFPGICVQVVGDEDEAYELDPEQGTLVPIDSEPGATLWRAYQFRVWVELTLLIHLTLARMDPLKMTPRVREEYAGHLGDSRIQLKAISEARGLYGDEFFSPSARKLFEQCFPEDRPPHVEPAGLN